MKVKALEHNVRNGAIRCRFEIYKTLHIFALAFTIFQILAFRIFYLENLGQGRGVQRSQ